ncbi:hypothetical protein [Thermogutta sp.]|jgi:hypothetical protein|uniref:hypothetical protein n=1 Tax=Thermogutta sp. TaxID=1962930 RepID=UPI00322018F9
MQEGASNTPELKTLGDVVRWVIAELGAMCPSPERLAAYFANPDDASLRDVRYHVEEARCPICRAERETMQRATSD